MVKQDLVWRKVFYHVILIMALIVSVFGLYQLFYNNHWYSLFIFTLGFIGVMSFVKKTILKILIVVFGLIIILCSNPLF